MALVSAFLGLTLIGCGGPSRERVTSEFRQDDPTLTVTGVAPGEGDASTVYMHIRYLRPGRASECEVIWGYQESQGEWVVFYKGKPGLAGTVCEGCTPKPCP